MPKPICFTIQKFGNVFYDDLYDDVIEIAVKEANALCVRADRILGTKPPLEKIRSSISEAAICIAEVTEDNPNVFYEVGWAFALGKKTFILWDKSKPERTNGLPFDIQDKAGIPYDSSKAGWRKALREKLTENIEFELSNIELENQNKALEMDNASGSQAQPPSKISIATLLNKYLPYCDKYHSPRTYEAYSTYIRSFLKHMGEGGNEPASSLNSTLVEEWIYHQKDWGDNYTRGAITALQIAYNWAVERKYVTMNPLKEMEKPKATKRNNPMSLFHYEKILSLIDEKDNFRSVIKLVWNSDCRPEEIRQLEAQHIDLDRKYIHIPQGTGRIGQKPRVIHLNDEAKEVLAKLVEKHPTGKLFRNSRGKDWSKYALCNRIIRYSAIIGKSYALSDVRNGVLSSITVNSAA